MRTLSDADLLDLWEQGVCRYPLDRALLILAAVLPDVSYDDLADWPLGRRNRGLAAILQETDPHQASMRLVDHCLLDASAPHSWSDAELEEIGERMALADPQAETRLTLHCPECAHAWGETLDITSFLWTEIEGCARRLLFEIHVLASAYGWTEAEILSLSPHRRACYLEMVQA